jgi:hypothetical protein
MRQRLAVMKEENEKKEDKKKEAKKEDKDRLDNLYNSLGSYLNKTLTADKIVVWYAAIIDILYKNLPTDGVTVENVTRQLLAMAEKM